MTARYIALAVHAPEKLPPRPVFLCAPQREMSDQEMKSRLLTWAEKEAT